MNVMYTYQNVEKPRSTYIINIDDRSSINVYQHLTHLEYVTSPSGLWMRLAHVSHTIESVFITQSNDMTGHPSCFNFQDAPGFAVRPWRWRIAVLCRPMAIATSEEEPWGCAANGVVVVVVVVVLVVVSFLVVVECRLRVRCQPSDQGPNWEEKGEDGRRLVGSVQHGMFRQLGEWPYPI